MDGSYLFWNCAGGIKSKIDYLRDYIIGKNLSLIFISEADIYEFDLNLVQIRGYECILANTKRNGKGRVVCYVQSNIPCSIVPVDDDLLDVIAITIVKALELLESTNPSKFLHIITHHPFCLDCWKV